MIGWRFRFGIARKYNGGRLIDEWMQTILLAEWGSPLYSQTRWGAVIKCERHDVAMPVYSAGVLLLFWKNT